MKKGVQFFSWLFDFGAMTKIIPRVVVVKEKKIQKNPKVPCTKYKVPRHRLPYNIYLLSTLMEPTEVDRVTGMPPPLIFPMIWSRVFTPSK